MIYFNRNRPELIELNNWTLLIIVWIHVFHQVLIVPTLLPTYLTSSLLPPMPDCPMYNCPAYSSCSINHVQIVDWRLSFYLDLIACLNWYHTNNLILNIETYWTCLSSFLARVLLTWFLTDSAPLERGVNLFMLINNVLNNFLWHRGYLMCRESNSGT